MRATFMSTSDTPSSVQLTGRREGETPAFSEWIHLTMLVRMTILPIYVHFNYVNYKSPETGDRMCRVRNNYLPRSILYLPNTSFSIT